MVTCASQDECSVVVIFLDAWRATTSGKNEACLKVWLAFANVAVARFLTRNIYACICEAHYFK